MVSLSCNDQRSYAARRRFYVPRVSSVDDCLLAHEASARCLKKKEDFMSVRTGLPPGPSGLPIVGHMFALRNDPMHLLRGTQRRYERMATLNVMNTPIVCCFQPEQVLYCLTEHPRSFRSVQSQGSGNLKEFLGDGLLTSEGDFHRQQRRLVQPSFHRQHIEQYAATMVQYMQEQIDEWQRGEAGQVVDIASTMQLVTLRIIIKTLFNVDSRPQAIKLGKDFTNVISHSPRRLLGEGRIVSRLFDPSGKRVQQAIESRDALDSFVYDLIQQRRAEGGDQGDILSMLLASQDEGQSMTDKQIRDQVMTFMAAGHETAQNSLSWALYLLSQHPPVYEKLLAELHTVLAGRAPTVKDLAQLPYLEWVVNEAWRVYPPAWRQGRIAIEPVEIDGYHFPTGTIFMVSQWVTHNIPEIWGDPEQFRPERWDPAQGKKPPHGAYFPFGLGPRICIGMPFAQMEVRLLLATLLQQYVPQLVPGHPVEPLPRVTIRPKYGMRMTLQPA
jgi:cytochrome P450